MVVGAVSLTRIDILVSILKLSDPAVLVLPLFDSEALRFEGLTAVMGLVGGETPTAWPVAHLPVVALEDQWDVLSSSMVFRDGTDCVALKSPGGEVSRLAMECCNRSLGGGVAGWGCWRTVLFFPLPFAII